MCAKAFLGFAVFRRTFDWIYQQLFAVHFENLPDMSGNLANFTHTEIGTSNYSWPFSGKYGLLRIEIISQKDLVLQKRKVMVKDGLCVFFPMTCRDSEIPGRLYTCSLLNARNHCGHTTPRPHNAPCDYLPQRDEILNSLVDCRLDVGKTMKRCECLHLHLTRDALNLASSQQNQHLCSEIFKHFSINLRLDQFNNY